MQLSVKNITFISHLSILFYSYLFQYMMYTSFQGKLRWKVIESNMNNEDK